MIETKGVLHFTISVSDVDRSERFYCDILGLELVQKSSLGMVFLKAGQDHVILCHSKTPIDPNPGMGILVHHAFRVDPDGYEKAVAELRAHGVDILFEEDRHGGVFQGRQAYFHDPDRNVIEINALRHIGTREEVNARPGSRQHFTHQPPDL
jgi:catechol 2,3-dioxygenase-like lactoylglutathione lyase family enzyme